MSSGPPQASFQRLAEFLGRHHGELLGIAGIVVGVAATLNFWLCLVTFGVAMGLYALALSGRKSAAQKAGRRLQDILENLDHLTRLDGVMMDLARTVGLRNPWRISLYEVVEGRWLRRARVSDYYDYSVSGERTLPSDEGVIGWAARTGGFNELLGIPARDEDVEGFVNFHQSRSVGRSRALNFTMASRSYACVTANLPLAERSVNVALVLESGAPDGVTPVLVQRAVTPQLLSLLLRLAVIGPEITSLTEGSGVHIDTVAERSAAG